MKHPLNNMKLKTYIEIPVEVHYDVDEDVIIIEHVWIRDKKLVYVEEDIQKFLDDKDVVSNLIEECKKHLREQIKKWNDE